LKRRVWKQSRRIKSRRSYTMKELAKLLGIHRRTVQAWRQKGLTPIDPDDKPLLFMGGEIRRFLAARRQAGRCPLQPDEFYCPRCRAARRSTPDSVQVEDTGRRMGECDSSLLIRGECIECGCRMNRFSTRKRLNPAWRHKLPTQGDQSLYGQSGTVVNSTISGGWTDVH